MTLKAIAFDAYGTLLDVYSIGVLAEQEFPGHGARLAGLWRDKQIEYTRLRTLCDRHADFWVVTGDALDFACDSLGLNLTHATRNQLMTQYEHLTAFEENAAALAQLRDAGIPLAVLSNGTPKMIESAMSTAGLSQYFDHILSVENVGKFKTAPEAYQMGPDAFDAPANEILFVSSNCWDICGATWFGYHTIWLNRHHLPLERLGVQPHHIGHTLQDVVTYALKRRG